MTGLLRQIRQSIEQLNPGDVRQSAERPIRVRLTAGADFEYATMERFLLPDTLSPRRMVELRDTLLRGGTEPADLELVYSGTPAPRGSFPFDPRDSDSMIRLILAEREELGLPLARAYPPFREAVTSKIIYTVSKENALFSLMTAVPDIIPGIALPWAVPEAVSDTAVLTVNQVRMAFLLAGASNRPLGYSEQRAEIGGIIAGAFGWRAIARELIGKIPAGGGLIPKAGIAFAGTFVEGMSLERLYRVGYGLTQPERKAAYGEALERGKQVAASLWERVRPQRS